MTTLPALYIAVTIYRPADTVYAFASNPENLPQWAAGLGSSIEQIGEDWVSDSPMGRITVNLAPQNSFGVLDHEVTVPSGETFYNPMRVFSNRDGCEAVFTLYRQPNVTDDEFATDEAAVRKDLTQLKTLMEA